jgi:DNA-binding response OmpR family regulator
VPAPDDQDERTRLRAVEVSPRPRIILLIEDDPDSRAELRGLLEEEGYAVIEAPDARTGLQLAVIRRPDLIIQDLLLPDSAGFDLVAELRRLPGGARLPILALSAFPDRLSEAQVNAVGFSTFIRKPPIISELCATIRKHLASPDQ